jgi:hypothetical protein
MYTNNNILYIGIFDLKFNKIGINNGSHLPIHNCAKCSQIMVLFLPKHGQSIQLQL